MTKMMPFQSQRQAIIGDAIMLVGRLCLAALFVAGATQKFMSPDTVQQMLAAKGWSAFLVWPALAINAIGAVCLVLGIWLVPMALGLAVYCMATSVFHYIPDDPWQMSIFVKNWAIAGGLLVLCSAEIHAPRG